MTILIADSGSTKTDWILHDTSQHTSSRFVSSGLNPCLMDDEELMERLAKEVLPHILHFHTDRRLKHPTDGASILIDHVHFYGAGCRPDQIERMQHLIGHVLRADSVKVASDLLGAAHALCGHAPGIIAILGTGSGSAVYDGENFTAQTPSLGFILGDEGSGAALGRRLVGDLYKRQLPTHLLHSFEQEQQATLNDIIHHVYRAQSPNRYLAHFTHFISAHLDEPSLYALVVDEFQRFFTRNCQAYRRSDLDVNFVGSIARVFSSQLSEAADRTGFSVGRILPSPIDDLGRYCLQEHRSEGGPKVNN